MDIQQRIEQFTRMAEGDPDNELGHFSLGKALAEAGRFADAVGEFERVIELNPDYSVGYHMLAAARIELGHRDAALETLRGGIAVADRRGDRMPRNEMARMMTDLGAEPPATAATAGAPAAEVAPAGKADLACARCGRPSQRMEKQPFKGELGERVWEKVCHGCWREWVSVGTKVINELGLQLSSPHAQQVYDEHMVEFLQIER